MQFPLAPTFFRGIYDLVATATRLGDRELIFALLLLLWQLLVLLGGYDKFILPGPLDVMRQFGVVLADGRLVSHSLITLSEVIPGLLIGAGISLPLGYLLAKSPLAERLIAPYLIASQAVPVIAIAPLLTIWISSTFWARVLVAVLVVFFPVLINIIAGLRSVPHELYELMHSLHATRWQIFHMLEYRGLAHRSGRLEVGGDA